MSIDAPKSPRWGCALLALGLVTGAWGCQETHKVEGFPERYAGIGIELTAKNGSISVVRTLAGGPSESAGIKAGDKVVAINGRSTEGMSLGDAVVQLRGKPNSQLTLSLERKGERMLVVLKRARLARAGNDYKKVE